MIGASLTSVVRFLPRDKQKCMDFFFYQVIIFTQDIDRRLVIRSAPPFSWDAFALVLVLP